MFKRLKVNTAWLICLTFIFRLLFVNVGLAATSTSHDQRIVKSHFSTILKKRRQVDAMNNIKKGDFSVVEISEEVDDDDDDKITNPLLLVKVLYSLFEGSILSSIKKVIPTRNYSYSISSERYLKLQVIRI